MKIYYTLYILFYPTNDHNAPPRAQSAKTSAAIFFQRIRLQRVTHIPIAKAIAIHVVESAILFVSQRCGDTIYITCDSDIEHVAILTHPKYAPNVYRPIVFCKNLFL